MPAQPSQSVNVVARLRPPVARCTACGATYAFRDLSAIR